MPRCIALAIGKAKGRRRSRRPESLAAEVGEGHWPEVADTADQVLENLATRAAIAAVASLSPLQAEVIMLRVVAGLGTEAVAQLVGRSPGAVRVAVHRGPAAAGPDDDRGGCNAMSGWDVSDADMPNIPGSPRADVPELPDGALEALLTGDLITDEASAGLQPAAALLAALNAAPQDGELAGHARVLAEFRRRGGMPVHARRSARRRSRLLTVLLTAKAAAAAAAAAVALGGVAAAAYTGTLPAPAQQFAHGVIGAPSSQPSHRPATPQPSYRPGAPRATPAARMPSA